MCVLIDDRISIFFVEIFRTMGGLERLVAEAEVDTRGFGGVAIIDVVDRIVGDVVLSRSDGAALLLC
jgi:hypothetical protein